MFPPLNVVKPSLTRWAFFGLALVATRYKTLYWWLHSGYMDTK